MEHLVENEKEERESDISERFDVTSQKKKKSKYDLHLEYLRELCFELKDKIYVFIDAIEQLSRDEHVEKLDFLFNTEKIQMVATCTDTYELSYAVKFGTTQLEIQMLGIDDAKKVAERILRSDSRDYISALETELFNKKSMKNALYISFLIQRLNMMDQEEIAKLDGNELVTYSTQIVHDMPDDLAQAAVEILKNAINKISGSQDGLLWEAVCFLAVSRMGLNLNDLKAIFQTRGDVLPELDMVLLMRYLDTFFYKGEEDRINFTHKVIRIGILERIEDRTVYEKEIKHYLFEIADSELLIYQESMYYARITKDYDGAGMLMYIAYQMNESVLLNAIREEAVSDEGAFYRQLIFWEKEVSSWIILFLKEKILGSLDLSKKEKKAQITLLQSILEFWEVMYKKEKKSHNYKNLIESYLDVGIALIEGGQPDQAIVYYEKYIEYFEDVCAKNQGQANLWFLSLGYYNKSRAFSEMGQSNEALEFGKKTLKLQEKLYKQDESNKDIIYYLSRSYAGMGHIYLDRGENDESRRNFEKSLECREKLYKLQQTENSLLDLSYGYHDLSVLLRELGQLEEALKYCEKSLKYREEVYVNKQDDKVFIALSYSYHNMGWILKLLQRLDESHKYYEKCLKCREEIYVRRRSKDSLRDLSIAYNDFGDILICQNQFEEALRCIEKSKEYAEELYQSQKNEKNLEILMVCYNGMRFILDKLEQRSESLEWQIKSMECREKLYATHQDDKRLRRLWNGNMNLARRLREMDQANQALIYNEKAVRCAETLYEKQICENSAYTLCVSFDSMGHTLQILKRYEDAYLNYKEALKYAEEWYAIEPKERSLKNVSICYENTVNMLMELRRYNEALAYFEGELKGLYQTNTNKSSMEQYIKALQIHMRCLLRMGRIEEIQVYKSTAIELAEQLYAETRLESDKKLLDELKNS